MPEHGDPRRYWRGCRCEPCRTANSRRCKQYWRAARVVKGGQPQRPMRVPVQVVTDHLAALLDSGWLRAHIEREASLAASHVYKMLSGHQRTVHRRVAARILALEPLRPVEVDEVVVARLLDGAHWRDLNATRAERLAALQLAMESPQPEGVEHTAARLGLNASRERKRAS